MRHAASSPCTETNPLGPVCGLPLVTCCGLLWPPRRWGKHVVVYGEAGLKKDHPVVNFLAAQGRCKSISYYKDG